MNLPPHLFAFVLSLIGFHMVFFYQDWAKKILGWCLFQTGLVVFLWSLAPGGPPLARVLALLIMAVTLSVGLVLWLYGRKSQVPKSPKASGRGSK